MNCNSPKCKAIRAFVRELASKSVLDVSDVNDSTEIVLHSKAGENNPSLRIHHRDVTLTEPLDKPTRDEIKGWLKAYVTLD
jgi:hypothetical protein